MSLIRHRPERGTKPPGAIAGPPPAAESCPSLRVSFEYRPGQGEDAGTGLCGVFDGLGSAGAEMITTSAGPRSSAWAAARAARAAVRLRTDLLSVRPPGWPDFGECRDAYAPRFRRCADQARNYDLAATEVARLRQRLESAQAGLVTTRQQLWDEYRTGYESLLSTPVRDLSGADGGPPATAGG